MQFFKYKFLLFSFFLSFILSFSDEKDNNDSTKTEITREYHYIRNYKLIDRNSPNHSRNRKTNIQKEESKLNYVESKNQNNKFQEQLNFKQFKRIAYVFASYSYGFSQRANVNGYFANTNVFSAKGGDDYVNNLISAGFALNLLNEHFKIEFETLFNTTPKSIYLSSINTNLTNADNSFGAYKFRLALVGNFLVSFNVNKLSMISVGLTIGAYNFLVSNDSKFCFGLGPIGELAFKINNTFDLYFRVKAIFFPNNYDFNVSGIKTTTSVANLTAGQDIFYANLKFNAMFMFSIGLRIYS